MTDASNEMTGGQCFGSDAPQIPPKPAPAPVDLSGPDRGTERSNGPIPSGCLERTVTRLSRAQAEAIGLVGGDRAERKGENGRWRVFRDGDDVVFERLGPEAASRIAELEAKLATAVGALERIKADTLTHRECVIVAFEALASIQERT